MDRNNLNSHDQVGDSTDQNNTENSGFADVETEQTVVRNDSPQQKTDNGEETQSVGSGSTETGFEGGSSNAEEKKRLDEAMKKIQNQKTHALYCPKCTLNITETAQLLEKGKETYPYNQKTFVVWIPLVIPFSLPWFPLNPPGPADIIQPPVVDPLEPDQSPSWLSKGSMRFLLVVVLLLLSVIVLWILQKYVIENGSPSVHVPIITPEGGGNNTSVFIPLSWPIHIPSIKYLFVFSLLLFLPILALAWRLKTDSTPSPTAILKLLTDMLRKYIVAPVRYLSSIRLDILKSIVYGGLIESITSLGVVSSAAGFGASALNVLALGIANLFSGIFLIIHNLCVLKWRPPYQGENHDHMPNLAEDQVAEDQVAKDPYQILLGKKDLALLHFVVVLVSFIFFALIPPLSYTFSFKIIDKENYKAAVVLAASLVCIISLSFAKAYAFGMDKRKTVAEYTGIAIGGSALSFIASQYFIDVLGKYDFH